MILEGEPQVLDFNPFEVRTPADASAQLGQEFQVADGRAFRYAKVGASNISKGKLQTAPAHIANHANVAASVAYAVGGFTPSFTLGNTLAGADIYAEGYLAVNDNASEGQTYKIRGHAAVAALGVITPTLADPVATAFTTSTEATFVHNAYNGVIEGTSATIRPAGVPLVSVSAGDFCWLQVRGIAAVLNGAAVTLGARLMADASTAGAVTDQTDVTAPQAEVEVGVASILAGVATEYRPIYLNIA